MSAAPPPDVFRDAVARLRAAGVDNPRLDARLLWEFAQTLSLSPTGGEGWGEGAIPDDQDVPPHPGPLPQWGRGNKVFQSLLARREAREPLAYITGHKEFWSLDFAVGPGVLVPRPETETLMEQLIADHPDRSAPLSVLDLGTGSGCLLVASLQEYPNARGVGVDSSARAIDYAGQNLRNHGLENRSRLLGADWTCLPGRRFHVVVSNPPYIASDAIAALEPEVSQHEPVAALDGGPDGLDAYRSLAPLLVQHLEPKGRAYLEIGRGQDMAVKTILEAVGLEVPRIAPDLSAVTRCVVATKV